MHPTQFSSFAVYMGNQPSRFGAVRHAKTSTGQTARQKPQALHISSERSTSHLPASPRDAFFSALKSAIPDSARHGLEHDLPGTGDVSASQSLGGLGIASGDGLEDAPMLAIRLLEAPLRLQEERVKATDGQPHHRGQAPEGTARRGADNFFVEGDVGGK